MQNKYSIAYILPNLFTSASIFSGILSMASAFEGEFEKAAWLIFLALIFDGLDGRVARLTNTCSRFGVEFDSLADVVSFGVAPAILLYLFLGHDYGRFGVVVAALYVIFGAIRLARFNVMKAVVEPSVFIGVPIPTAAVFIALMVLLANKYQFYHGTLLLGLSIVISFLMVSNIRYPSFKKIDLQKQYTRKIFIGLTLLCLIIFIYPIEGVFLFFLLYILYGVLRAGYNLLFRKTL